MKKLYLPSFFIVLSFSASAQLLSNGFNFTNDRIAIGTNAWTGKRLNVQANDADHIALMENSSSSGFGLVMRAANDPLRIVPFPGTGNPLFVVGGSGNVGIGTASPGIWFGSKTFEFADARPVLKLSSTSATGLATMVFTNSNVDGGTHAGEFHLNYEFNQANIDKSLLRFGGYPGGTALVIVADGNVGIGTTVPDAKLAVKGTIHTQEVKVDLTGAVVPDYVFEKNYNLLSLEEVNTYIQQNKHLPEVPSAKEFEAEGMKLKEMNVLLLKKVEELTLYMIDLKKENEIQRAQNSRQQTEIDLLKNKIK